MSESYDFSFQTGTATLAIFDLSAIQHRLTDTADWWSITEDELQEVNAGNILFIGLGTDGSYHVRLAALQTEADCSFYLSVPSGRVFIGAAEDTSADGLEPDDSVNTSGSIIQLQPGYYQVRLCRSQQRLTIEFRESTIWQNHLFTSAVLL